MKELINPPRFVLEGSNAPVIGQLTLRFHNDGGVSFYPDMPPGDDEIGLAESFLVICYIATFGPSLALHAFRCCESRGEEELHRLAKDMVARAGKRLKCLLK